MEHAIGNWRKVTLVMKQQGTWLKCVLVFCGGENLQASETGYLPQEISKWFGRSGLVHLDCLE